MRILFNFEKLIVTLILFIAFIIPSAFAEETNTTNSPTLHLETATGFKLGELNYQIGGDITAAYKSGKYAGTTQTGTTYMPLSELRYPLNTPTAGIAFSLFLYDRFDIKLEGERNINRYPNGKMKDSDWINGPASLDVYSESDLWADLQQYDAEFGMRTKRNNILNNGRIGIGLKTQSYRFKTYNTFQTYPSTNHVAIYIGGQTLAYSFDAVIPYVSATYTFKPLPDIDLKTKLKFTPFATTKDTDEHLVRNIVSHGKTIGTYFELSAELTKRLAREWSISTISSYSLMSTKGNDTQKHYSPLDELDVATINVQHAVSQFNFILSMKFDF